MRNLIVFIAMVLVLSIAMIIGTIREGSSQKGKDKAPVIPNIGSVEVLNGCGAVGAANDVADFLRASNFDVKGIGNAENWNYPYTMVISRKSDMSIAKQVAKALKTDKLMMERNGDQHYDVTVVIGPDYGALIK